MSSESERGEEESMRDGDFLGAMDDLEDFMGLWVGGEAGQSEKGESSDGEAGVGEVVG